MINIIIIITMGKSLTGLYLNDPIWAIELSLLRQLSRNSNTQSGSSEKSLKPEKSLKKVRWVTFKVWTAWTAWAAFDRSTFPQNVHMCVFIRKISKWDLCNWIFKKLRLTNSQKSKTIISIQSKNPKQKISLWKTSIRVVRIQHITIWLRWLDLFGEKAKISNVADTKPIARRNDGHKEVFGPNTDILHA